MLGGLCKEAVGFKVCHAGCSECVADRQTHVASCARLLLSKCHAEPLHRCSCLNLNRSARVEALA